ncbi:MAG TPA: TonB-dependent receptor [Gemmatimonadaceae bacterium]|nr:TonB-dependent receptor [Gemmatimonadaceae bacterium]
MRGAASLQRHRHIFGAVRERDRHVTWIGEASLTASSGRSLWVAGAAIQQERYAAEDVANFDYRFTAPALFGHHTLTLTPALLLTASARVDRHSAYGPQVAPRVSALVRLGGGWTARVSGGGGYFAPTPFTEETEVIGLARLTPLAGIREERARSGSVDLGGAIGPIETHLTAFGSVIEHPIGLRPLADDPLRVELVNLGAPTRTSGAELLLRWQPEPLHVTASYTFVRSTEMDPDAGVRRAAPLTPRHQAGIVAMWEREEQARVGVELYYTGRQALDDNPYRDTSQPYVHMGILAERRFGGVRVFVNAENLFGYRQTRHDPLVRPAPGLGGRWTTDVWGPLEGRVANAGVRVGGR